MYGVAVIFLASCLDRTVDGSLPNSCFHSFHFYQNHRIMNINAIRFIGIFSVVVALSGCMGMKVWEKGDYFQSDLSNEFKPEEVSKIGIYVFSEGEPVDGSDRPFDIAELMQQILLLPVSLATGQFSFGQAQVGLSKKFYPPAVTKGLVMEPDTSNSGPSLELANKVKEKLNEYGYTGEVVTELGHGNEISTQQCLQHAKEAGYDGALVIYYAGLSKWTKFAGTETHTYYRGSGGSTSVTTTLYDIINGYLYLPNATLFSTKSEDILWSNWYYGIYENAHLFNLSGEEFTDISDDVLFPLTDEDYFKAANKAAAMIFEPAAWPDSFNKFPKRETQKGKM